MIYAPAKVEAAMSNTLGGNAFTRNEALPSTSCDLCTCKKSLKLLWPMVKEMHYQENTLFELDPKVKGVNVTPNFAQYPRLHVTYAPAKFDVATPHG